MKLYNIINQFLLYNEIFSKEVKCSDFQSYFLDQSYGTIFILNVKCKYETDKKKIKKTEKMIN